MIHVRPIFQRVALVAIFLVLGFRSNLFAHKPSDSYLRFTGGGEYLTAEWDISLKDLEFLIGLDTNRDGDITWGELKSQRESITSQALDHLTITVNGDACQIDVTNLLVTQHSDGAYAVLVLQTDCPGDAEILNIEYSFLFDVDPTHRGLVLYQNEATTSTHVLSRGEPTLQLTTAEHGLLRTLVEYIRDRS